MAQASKKSEIVSFNASSMTDALATQHTTHTKKNLGVFVKATNEAFIEALKSGQEVGLKDFGSFSFAVQSARSGKTPNGVAYSTDEKNRIKFNVGKAFADRVAETTGTINRPSKSAKASQSEDVVA